MENTTEVVNNDVALAALACRRDLPAPLDWPQSINAAAFHGLAGEAVDVLDPHTEADRVAILLQLLVLFGSVIGKSAHFVVEATRHFLNLFVVLVGSTGSGRKGTSFGQSVRMFADVDPEWAASRMMMGLSSGEGLIYNVRDPIEKEEPIKQKGRVVEYQPVILDHGVDDKRLLVVESEFASTLKVMSREGNTLSAIIRQAWDGGDLRTMTKNEPLKATGAHVSIVGHITAEELLRHLSQTEQANGFANRFLWLAVRQSKYLPFGGNVAEEALKRLQVRFAEAVSNARTIGGMQFTAHATASWPELYYELSQHAQGIVGTLTARSHAQVRRLACLYALLDNSAEVDVWHLRAALAVWKYSEPSVRFIFDREKAAHDASAIYDALVLKPEGMTRTELSAVFGRNKVADEIEAALIFLQNLRRVRKQRSVGPTGRPAERWFAVPGGRTDLV